MKTRTCIAIIVAAHLLAVPSDLAGQRESSTEAYLDRLHREGKERVIVQFKDDAEVDASLVHKHGGKLIRKFSTIKALVCELPQASMEPLRKEASVLRAYPDLIVRIDPGKEKRAAEEDAGVTPKYYSGPATVRWNNLEAGVNTKAAWDQYDLDGTGVTVAFIDTGVNYALTNLGGGIGPGFKCLGGYDFVDDDPDPINPNTSETHGTRVVSLGVGAGLSKVAGVAYNANYYALRALGYSGTGLISDTMAAIEWASTEPHKADMISMSLTVYDEDHQGEPLWPSLRASFEIVCNNAYSAGVVLVGASGNNTYDHSGYPAGFANVISVGAHREDQTVPGWSNGGVDVVAPGEYVYTVNPDDVGGWLVSGTSYAAPHAAGLLALQIQYARQRNVQPNNGYLWEVMKYSAKDMPLITNVVYRGNGKIWAAETDPPPADPKDGSIDAMAKRWPLAFGLTWSNAAYWSGGLPVYCLGSELSYGLALTNNTAAAGNYANGIVNLEVTTAQAYYQAYRETNLPGAAVEAFPRAYVPPAAMAPDITLDLADFYAIPPEVELGTNRLALELAFELAGDTNHRPIRVTYPYAGLWLARSASNQPPVAADLSVVAGKGTDGVSFALPASDPDVAEVLTAVVVSGPSNGVLTVTEGIHGVYRAWTNAPLEDGFEYYVHDAGGLVSATNLVTITLTNAPPVAFAQGVTNLAEAATAIVLSGADGDGDAVSYQVTSGPLHGALAGGGSNVVYTSDNNWYGPDAFSFTASDGWTNSPAATVTLTVLPVNRQPLITAFQPDGTNFLLQASVQPGRTTLPQHAGALGAGWEDLTALAQAVPMATNLTVPASFLLPAGTNASRFYRLESRVP